MWKIFNKRSKVKKLCDQKLLLIVKKQIKEDKYDHFDGSLERMIGVNSFDAFAIIQLDSF